MSALKTNLHNRLLKVVKTSEASTTEDNKILTEVFYILTHNNLQGFISKKEVEKLCVKYGLSVIDLSLLILPLAACYAHPLISKFHVGAITIGKHEDLYFGGNQEFLGTAINQSIHAEQSAISHAWLRGETAIKGISVNHTPCGHCRQFMNELNTADELLIHLPHRQNNPLQDFLPDSFGPNDLDIITRLFENQNHKLKYQPKNNLEKLALDMANKSYAPYSKGFNGVALQVEDGNLFGGAYMENAAFNPSFLALQMAINYLYLNGYELEHINDAVLIESDNKLSYQTMAEELLRNNSPIQNLTTIKL